MLKAAKSLQLPDLNLPQEKFITEVALSVFEHSAQFWVELAINEPKNQVLAKSAGPIVRGDVKGAVAGAGAAAASSWWSGVAVSFTSAVGAVVGAAIASAITYLEEEAKEEVKDKE